MALRTLSLWLLRMALLGLLLALASAMLRGLNWRALSDLIATASLPALGLAGCVLALRPLVWGVRWRAVIGRSTEPPPHGWTTLAVAAALLIDHLTPTARLFGGLLRARWLLRGARDAPGSAFGGVLFDQLSHEVLMAFATMLGVIMLPLLLGRPALGLAAALAAVAFVTAAWIALRRRGAHLAEAAAIRLDRAAARRPGRLGILLGHGRDGLATVGQLVGDRKLVSGCLGWSALFLALNLMGQWAVFEALGIDVGAAVVFTAVTIGATMGIVTATPGGLGATEAAMITLFVALGLDGADATAGVLLYRALHYIVVIALGLPALAWLELGETATP